MTSPTNTGNNSNTANPCDPVVQGERQLAIEAAYLADGRGEIEHPQHGLYTGLVEQAPMPVVITDTPAVAP